jgi:hypothetical protein
MKKTIPLVFSVILVVGSARAQAQGPKPSDPWARLSFLVGEWQGVGSGEPGEAVGGTSFAFSLDKKILIRKSWTQFRPRAGEKPGLSHEDLLIIYPGADGAPFRAIYFDNEGHVIMYSVSFPPKSGAAIFETDPREPGPRFRLTYELNADGVLENAFSIAPPGGEFRVHVRGALKKK